jgi:RNA recognition motif-containing protein
MRWIIQDYDFDRDLRLVSPSQYCVCVMGLPPDTTKEDILEFFSPKYSLDRISAAKDPHKMRYVFHSTIFSIFEFRELIWMFRCCHIKIADNYEVATKEIPEAILDCSNSKDDLYVGSWIAEVEIIRRRNEKFKDQSQVRKILDKIKVMKSDLAHFHSIECVKHQVPKLQTIISEKNKELKKVCQTTFFASFERESFCFVKTVLFFDFFWKLLWMILQFPIQFTKLLSINENSPLLTWTLCFRQFAISMKNTTLPKKKKKRTQHATSRKCSLKMTMMARNVSELSSLSTARNQDKFASMITVVQIQCKPACLLESNFWMKNVKNSSHCTGNDLLKKYVITMNINQRSAQLEV